MKRRILLGILVLALMALAMPIIAAQDNQTVWDLTENLKFTDLGFNFNYPAGWKYAATKSSGVFFASSQSDLDAVTDDDPNTLASDSSFQLIGTQLADLKKTIGDDPTLENIADFVVKSRGITENEKRVEVPVMTRRSLIVLGEDQAKQGWILSIWEQGDFAVGAFLSSPSYKETVRIAYTWGVLLGGIKPNDALPLSKNTISLPTVGAEINYPEGWYPDSKNTNNVYELKSDLKNNGSEGYLIITSEQTLADFKLKKTATLDDVVEADISTLALTEPVRHEEFILLGEPTITIRGTDGSGQYILLTQTLIDDNVLRIGIIGPTEAKIDEIEPTFIAMLQSLHSTNAS